jgi:hypothetical protein
MATQAAVAVLVQTKVDAVERKNTSTLDVAVSDQHRTSWNRCCFFRRRAM